MRADSLPHFLLLLRPTGASGAGRGERAERAGALVSAVGVSKRDKRLGALMQTLFTSLPVRSPP